MPDPIKMPIPGPGAPIVAPLDASARPTRTVTSTTTESAAPGDPNPRATVTTVETTHKPGWRTTEFYLTGLAMLIAGLRATGIVGEDDPSKIGRIVALVAFMLAALGYTVARGLAKAK